MTNTSTPPTTSALEGPGKGRAFFDRAKTVAETGNFDYAIDMWVEGLNREPQNMAQHQALYDVGLRRKVKGGKPAGGIFGAKGPLKGKTPKDQMLNAEWLLAKDPGNMTYMRTILENAAAAGYDEIIRWFAPIVMLANKAKPKKEIYVEIAGYYEKVKEYEKASEAIRGAIEQDPNDMELMTKSKDLAAQEAMKKGNYDTAETFSESIKNKDETKKLNEEENLAKSRDYLIKQMEAAKADYDRNPIEHQHIAKYAKTLEDLEEENYENLAIELLQKAYVETKTYRYRLRLGDIKMKQFKRNTRMLAEAVKMDPSDKTMQHQLQELLKERLVYELDEYRDRVANYPTDMTFQYEYGLRLYHARRFDEAIHAFQIAQNNPRVRTETLYRLGRSFLEQGMMQEAMETLQRAIESYELADTGDTKTKEYHYWLARVYEDTGRKPDAVKVYSKITQWDIGFLDSRKRLEALRKEV